MKSTFEGGVSCTDRYITGTVESVKCCVTLDCHLNWKHKITKPNIKLFLPLRKKSII